MHVATYAKRESAVRIQLILLLTLICVIIRLVYNYVTLEKWKSFRPVEFAVRKFKKWVTHHFLEPRRRCEDCPGNRHCRCKKARFRLLKQAGLLLHRASPSTSGASPCSSNSFGSSDASVVQKSRGNISATSKSGFNNSPQVTRVFQLADRLAAKLWCRSTLFEPDLVVIVTEPISSLVGGLKKAETRNERLRLHRTISVRCLATFLAAILLVHVRVWSCRVSIIYLHSKRVSQRECSAATAEHVTASTRSLEHRSKIISGIVFEALLKFNAAIYILGLIEAVADTLENFEKTSIEPTASHSASSLSVLLTAVANRLCDDPAGLSVMLRPFARLSPKESPSSLSTNGKNEESCAHRVLKDVESLTGSVCRRTEVRRCVQISICQSLRGLIDGDATVALCKLNGSLQEIAVNLLAPEHMVPLVLHEIFSTMYFGGDKVFAALVWDIIENMRL